MYHAIMAVRHEDATFIGSFPALNLTLEANNLDDLVSLAEVRLSELSQADLETLSRITYQPHPDGTFACFIRFEKAVDTELVRINICLSKHELAIIDRCAISRGLSRSAWLRRAAANYISH